MLHRNKKLKPTLLLIAVFIAYSAFLFHSTEAYQSSRRAALKSSADLNHIAGELQGMNYSSSLDSKSLQRLQFIYSTLEIQLQEMHPEGLNSLPALPVSKKHIPSMISTCTNSIQKLEGDAAVMHKQQEITLWILTVVFGLSCIYHGLKHAIAVSRINKEVDHLNLALDIAGETLIAKNDFLAGLTHQIRTPLNSILGSAELIRKEYLNEEQQRYVDIIRKTGISLQGLVDDLIDLSDVNRDDDTIIAAKSFALRNFVYDMGKALSPRLYSREQELMVHFDELTEHMVIETDPDKLRYILFHLVAIANKKTSDRVNLQLFVLARQKSADDYSVHFSINIPPKVQEEQALLLNQASVRSTADHASDLGLNLCERIATILRGRIHADYDENLLQSISFEMPVKVSNLKAGTENIQQLYPSLLHKHGMQVLLIDDNREMASYYGDLIHKILPDLNLTICTSELDAMHRLHKHKYDVIIIDYAIGDNSGLDLLRKAAEIAQRQLPSILLTPTDIDKHVFKLGRVKPDMVLLKPIDPISLLKHLEELSHENKITPANSKPRLHGLRILVSDDNSVNLTIAERILTKEGAIVSLAHDGLEAVDAAKNKDFDIVLMDCEMPNMNGYDASLNIREKLDAQQLPILALTASIFMDTQDRCSKSGMNGLISRPFTREKLCQTIREFCPEEKAADLEEDLCS